MIYCFGDSLTEGRPGITYVKYLAGKGPHINCGLGGDTLIGVTKRLLNTLKSKLPAEDIVIIGIGTNDILLPHFAVCSPSWQMLTKAHIRRGSIPCSDITEFREKYEQLIAYVQGITANIIVFGLPCLECTTLDLDSACAKYNLEIEAICRRENIPFVDFRKWQLEQKALQQNEGSYFLTTDEKSPAGVLRDIMITTVMPFSETVCKKRGLALTVDGCHLNELSARGLAGLISKYID